MSILEWSLASILISFGLAAQSRATRQVHADFATLTQTRDSFVYVVNGTRLGFMVWQLSIVPSPGVGQAILETHAYSAFEIEEQLGDHYSIDSRTVMDLHSAEAVTFNINYHILPARRHPADTTQERIRIDIRSGHALVQWRQRRRDGEEAGSSRTVVTPAGTIFQESEWLVAAALSLAPGDSVVLFALPEMSDQVKTVNFVAERPRRIRVSMGDLEVLPVRVDTERVFVTRVAPRRVVRIEVGSSHYDLVRTARP